MYLEIQTIVGLLHYGRLSTKPPCGLSLFLANFVYRLNMQRPKRHVSVGALDEVKPDVNGLR